MEVRTDSPEARVSPAKEFPKSCFGAPTACPDRTSACCTAEQSAFFRPMFSSGKKGGLKRCQRLTDRGKKVEGASGEMVVVVGWGNDGGMARTASADGILRLDELLRQAAHPLDLLHL